MVLDADFCPSTGLQDSAVVIAMAIRDIGARNSKAPMRDIVEDLTVQQEHRSKVRHRPICIIELPYTVPIHKRPRSTKACIDAMLKLQDEFMPQIVEITRIGFLQVNVHIRESVSKLDVSQPFIEAILHGTLDAERIHTLLVLRMIRALGIGSHIAPVDDVSSPAMV